MPSVDEEAVECVELETGGVRSHEMVKHKESLLRISQMRQQPILKCGKQYAVIDGAGTAYIYDEK